MGIEGTHLNIIKDIYDKPTANIILNAESFLLKSGTSKDAHSYHFSSTHYCKSYLSNQTRESTQTCREEVKLSLYEDDTIPLVYIQKTTRTDKKIQQGSRT